MTKEQAIEKIKKLLRLAKSDNQGEALQALAAVQRLALQFELDIDTLNEEEVPDQATDSEIHEKTVGLSTHRRKLAAIVAPHFRCKVYTQSMGSQERIRVIGMHTDSEVFKSVFEWLWLVYKTLSDKAMKQKRKEVESFGYVWNRTISGRLKETYFMGFRKGVDQALEKNEQEHALMVIVPNAVIELERSLQLTRRKSKASEYLFDEDLYGKGLRDGKEASQMKKRLDNNEV